MQILCADNLYSVLGFMQFGIFILYNKQCTEYGAVRGRSFTVVKVY